MANKRATLIGFTLYALIVVSVVGKLAELIWQVRGNELSFTAPLSIDALLFGMVVPIVFGGVAALIVARRPGHAVGWLLLVPALAGAFPVPPVSALLHPPHQPKDVRRAAGAGAVRADVPGRDRVGALTAELRQIIQETLEPDQVSVWLKK